MIKFHPLKKSEFGQTEGYKMDFELNSSKLDGFMPKINRKYKSGEEIYF